MTHVVGERVDVNCAISNGVPQALALEIQHNEEPSTTIQLADLQLVGAAYRYSFVALASHIGWCRYRFVGVDSRGDEFAWPSDRHWDSFDIV
jgi:hypothetical protein